MAMAVEIPVPPGMSDEEVRSLLEEVAVHLFQTRHLSTREAADWLGVSYEDFRDLAARRGAATLEYDRDGVDRELQRLGGPRP